MAFVSAGAYARELDLSIYAETLTSTIVGMAHTFNKGPIGEETLITNEDRLIENFGEPIDPSVSSTACQGWFAAREYLKKGNKLYVTRVESTATPAEYAKASVQGSTDETLATGTNGATSIPATRELTSSGATFDADGVVVGDIVEIHEGTGDDGYYIIAGVTATVLTVDRDWPTGSLSSLDFTVWTAKKEGQTDGATSAASTRTLTSAAALFSSAGVAAGDIVVVNDTGDTGDNGVYTITSVDSETQLTVNRDWPEGSLTGLTYDVYGRNSAGADGSTAVAGEFSSAGAKFQDHGVVAGDILYINDSFDSDNNGYYLISGLKTGSEDTTVEVTNAAWDGGALTNLDYEILPGSITFQLLTKGTWGTGYQLTPKVNAGDRTNFDLDVRDSTGTIQYERVFNMDRSDVVATMAADSAYMTATVVASRGEPAIEKTFSVVGGNDGYDSIVDGDYIGTSAAETGLYSFKNPEAVDINIML